MSDRPLQHNPEPIKVTKATHQCVKCRQYAPRCTCWNGPDYKPLAHATTQVDPFIYRPGVKLPNGATIIAFHREGGDPPYYIVLAMWIHSNDYNDYEYITWAADLKGDCFWGHYHENIGTAVADYLERSSRG